jgi:AraC-like DNA-binding protein
MWWLDDLSGLELLRASYGEFVFAPHSHEAFLIALTEGGVGGPIYRGEQHQVSPGDLLVLNPEQAHAGGPLTDAPWRYRALYPNAGLMRRISIEFSGANRKLAEFREGVVADEVAAARIRMFHDAAEDPDASLLERDALLTRALVWLVGRHGRSLAELTALGREHRAVGTARDYLAAHLEANVSLSGLAEMVGLSPYHLCRVFRRDVGLTPHGYQEQVRVRHAKQLLREGFPIARAAAESGFYDQAHLTRRFKRVVGVTPGRFVRAGRDRSAGGARLA